MKKTLSILTLVSVALMACTSHKENPPIATYSFTPTVIAQATRELPKPITLRMMSATIVAQFSNRAFIYRTSSVQYLTDPYRQFLTAPNIEISNYLQNYLAPKINATLIAANNLMSANYILQENITALYADYQNKSAPTAVINMQFVLYHYDHGVTQQIATLALSEQTSIMGNDPESLLAGYKSDLNKMLQSSADFINRYVQ